MRCSARTGPTLKDWLITQWEHEDRLNTDADPEWLCGDAAPYDGGDQDDWDDPRDFSLGRTIRYCNLRGTEVMSPTPFLSARRDNVTADDARRHARMLYTEVSEMVYSAEWDRIELSRNPKGGGHINRYVKLFLPMPKCLQGQEPPWAEGIVAYAFGNIVETYWWKEFEQHNPKRPQEPEKLVCRPRPPPDELERPPRPDPPKLSIKVGDTWDPIPDDIVTRYSLRSGQRSPFTRYPILDEASLPD